MKKYGKYVIEIVLGILVITMLGMIFLVNIQHYYYNINADIASEGILARLIWESGEWIPSTWCIAAETRIFDIANLAALFYGITSNMSISVGLACSVMTCAIAGSAVYMMRSVKMGMMPILIFVLLCLALPNNFMMLEVFYLFAAYYSPHIVVLFLTLGVYARALDRKITGTGAVITLLLEFMLGMQGVRGILVIAGPIFAVEIVRYIYKVYKKEARTQNDHYIMGWSFLLMVSGFLGGLFPFSKEQPLSRNIRKAPQKFIYEVIPDIMKGSGMEDASGIEYIFICFFVVISVILLLGIILKGIKKQNVMPAEWVYLVLIGSPIATAFILAFTTTESTGRYFFVLIIAYAFAAAYFLTKNKGTAVIIICSIVIMVLNCFKVYMPIFRSPGIESDSRYQVVSYLQDKDYNMAYTDFENANTMGIMAEEPLRIAAIDSSAKMNICKWMTSTDWYVPNVPFESKTAYIITESRMKDFELFMETHKDDVWFETQIGGYWIFGSEYNFSILE